MLDVHVGLKQDDVLKRGGGEKKSVFGCTEIFS